MDEIQQEEPAMATSEKKRIRIQGDEHPYSLKITLAETGEEIPRVHSITWNARAGERFPEAVLEVYSPLVDIIVEAEIKHICPYCGHTQEKE